MDNIMNRPLFRRREARDRLNDMAGVQGYQVGGPVFADPTGAIRRPLSAGMPFIPVAPIRPAGLPSALPFTTGEETPDLYNRAASGMVSGAKTNLDVVRRQFELERTPENYQRVVEAEAALQEAIQQAQGLGSYVEEISAPPELPPALREMPQGPFADTKNPAFGEGPEQAVSQMSPAQLDIFGRLDRAAETPIPAVVNAPRPRGIGGARPEALAAGMPAAAAGAPGTTDQGPAFERTGRGAAPLIENPAQVAAGLNAPDPAVREKTAADFMQEFMANAPKYEGGDKKLMHAMIGFAIASGDSPNAMTNIAQGLQAGAQMFLQDKAAKDEFDRQIQLSAVQYGLGEAARERELGRQFTNYVANKGVTYRGRTYGPGESVPVLHSDIVNGRMPEGVITEGTSDALLATDAAIRKSMAEAAQNRVLSGAEYRSAIETLDNAASEYTSARNLMPLLEASLVRAANGEVTGISSALTRKMNEAMNAFGLKPPSEYESPEAFESALRQVSVSMVQDLLGESGKTISDADRRLIDGLIGLQQDIVSGVIKDPDILTRKVQELMRVLESKQRSALDTYTTAMEGYGGSFTPSGTPVRSYRAERVFNSEEASPQVRYQFDDQGRLVIVREGQ